MAAKLIWATPGGDDLVAHIARVSNPDNQDNKKTAPKLIRYLIDHKHWSPFEMVNACVEIETTRDIAHQLIRHRSFSFQEFSGRYAAYPRLNTERECRMQDTTNRQNSIPCDDPDILSWWNGVVHEASTWKGTYEHALRLGIAKEVARALLPEGLVPTTIYMNGSLRSWIHYWETRADPHAGQQKEHRLIAEETREVILPVFPMLGSVIWPERAS